MATGGATGGEELKRELSCPICLNFYKEPVILMCGHNFCRKCILTHWGGNCVDYGFQCPQCRAVFNKKSFTKNYLVQNLVAKMDDLDLLDFVPVDCKVTKEEGKCELHGEELKLYCHTDKKLICVICREARAHRRHEVAPVPEVVADMKMDLKMKMMKLNWQKSHFVSIRTADVRTKNDVQLKKLRLKEKIEADVGALVQFLLDERDALLDSLEAEEVATMAVLDENIKIAEAETTAVERAMSDIHGQLNGKTNFESLAKIHHYMFHFQVYSDMEPVNCSSDFADFSGPLQLIMWKKMMHVLDTIPQNLTLDPDTAHLSLIVSDFDTKVEEGRIRNTEPDLSVRFNRFFGVLATAQYFSGQHYWEVDVRDKGVWYVGVTTATSNRKGFVNLSPSAGYWSLCMQDRLYANEEGERIPIADYWDCLRIGVYLDYDNGRLCFYDAVTMRKLHVFDTSFDEPVCPFFSPGKNDPGSRLQICHYY